ncbi:peptidylprolyl isomerase [Myxacorys almedinensis]|uniref:peptidylprolyl isomerase n=1 Tax=Myxacorys almedinensis A TaxID=2690445 RepID=A0A8J7Z0Z5_9CYAN|nr:peptidylprolyl isomerase [Myxacorys almedinensis]NDJ15761.1 peptidylprolyl isomerase [Myxacorys almedinensis A]
MDARIAAFPEPDEIVKFLKKNVRYKEVCQQIVYQRIVDKVARDRGIVVTSQEIQYEADQFRRQAQLERAADALAWLAKQQITPDDWESGICDRVLIQKLMKTLFDQDVEQHFAEHRSDFDQVSLYQIIFSNERLAQEVFYQIKSSKISFYEAAYLYDVDEQRHIHGGYAGLFYRRMLQPEIAASVFDQAIGQVLTPVATDQGYHVLMVEKLLPAKLTPELRQELLQKRFQNWLEKTLNCVLQSQEL